MEKKCHLESGECAGVTSDPENSSKIIVKKDGGAFVCLECNTEFKYRKNIKRHQKLCKNQNISKQRFPWNTCDKFFIYKSKFDRHKSTHLKENFVFKDCYESFKRENHFMKHQCEFQVPALVNIHNNISNDLENQEPIGPETNEVVGDAQDEIVAKTGQLIPVTNIDINEPNTPPCCHQNWLGKYREWKVFDINKMLEKVEANEKEKILKKTVDSASNHENTFTEATMNYFHMPKF